MNEKKEQKKATEKQQEPGTYVKVEPRIFKYLDKNGDVTYHERPFLPGLVSKEGNPVRTWRSLGFNFTPQPNLRNARDEYHRRKTEVAAGRNNLAEVCDRCGSAFEAASVIPNMVQLQNVSLKLAQRITCDEEERQRFGYKLPISYRFPDVGGKLDRKDAEVFAGGTLIMRLSYGDATTLYRINLDLERGYWSRNQADEEDRDDVTAQGRTARVVPFVTDTKNALVLRFEPVRSDAEMSSLQAAVKQAIQQHFQLESRQLSCEAMPAPQDRQEILLHEASEGGAGVLRQLVEDPSGIPALARKALELCHFDPKEPGAPSDRRRCCHRPLRQRAARHPAAKSVLSSKHIQRVKEVFRWVAPRGGSLQGKNPSSAQVAR